MHNIVTCTNINYGKWNWGIVPLRIAEHSMGDISLLGSTLAMEKFTMKWLQTGRQNQTHRMIARRTEINRI